MTKAEDPMFREVDEVHDESGGVVAGAGKLFAERAEKIVEAIRAGHVTYAGKLGLMSDGAMKLNYELSKEAAVAMVEELMRPMPATEEAAKAGLLDTIAELCATHGYKYPPDDLRDWLSVRLQLGKYHARSRQNDLAHLREIETIGEAHGFSGHPVEFPSWLRVALDSRRLPAVADKGRIDLLTRIWNAAHERGWTSSDGTDLAGFVIGKMNELDDCKNQHVNLSRVSKAAFDATERGRVNAVGELRVCHQNIGKAMKERDEARADLKTMLRERNEARHERDMLREHLSDLQHRIGALLP